MDGKENPKDDSPLDHNDTCLYTYSNNHNHNYKHQHQNSNWHQKSKSSVTSNPRVTQNDNANADKDQYKLYSSSDENIQKTCNSNISTIDTQSINNILDGYEDLDCEKSSDSSSLNARNSKLETDIDIGTGINQHLDPHQEHLLQQKHQQLDKIFITAGKMRHRPTCCSSERLDKKQVLRVNQQTQVRQRPRDPVKEHQQQHQHHISSDAHKVSPFTGDGDLNSLIARSNTNIYENKKIPGRQVMYLQKGEVQKRVDEWLNHSQNLQLNKSNASCSGGSSNKLINSSNKREIYLTRSNSNIEQKRRYCNNESRLLNDKMESRLNDTVSFENLNSEQQLPRREYKAILSNDRINSQKETYRDYSAVRNGLRNHRLHHQDTDNLKVYKINQRDGVSQSSGDYFYSHPQLKQQRMSTYHQDIKVTCEKKGYFEEDKEIYSKSKLVSNGIRRVPSASRRPIRCADDPPSLNKARESRRQLITAPVNQYVPNSESVNETTAGKAKEKEPINHQTVNKELNKVKKPPPPPRRDFTDRNNREETFKHTLFNNQSGYSSFKPLGKLLTKQLGDCNANDDFDITIGRVHDIRLVTRNTDHDNDQIINNNSSLQCKTVHSDDLLSILTPAAKKSVYKEDYQEESDRGFANFTKEAYQNSNPLELTNVEAKSFKKRDNYYCKDNTCREHSIDNENDKVLSTFNKYNKDRLKEVIDEEKSSADKIEIVEKNLTSRSRSSSTNKVTDEILQESYEDRSTLKLDRDRGAIHTKDLESRGTLVADFVENSIFQHKNDDCFQSHLLNAKKSSKVETIYSKANSDSIHGELFKIKHKTMINNDSSCTPTMNRDVYNNLSLLKSSVDNSKGNNDSFEPLFNEETNQVKRFNFNSVLSDDYKNLHIREANRLNECKVYNTKEMKERQRLMDMLRKKDYHAVKLGAGRVCPSSMRDKHHDGSTPSDRGGCNTSLATNDLPLESLWAAGLDEGMGFPQRCYYANHRTIPITPTTPNKNTEQIWHERNTPFRTPTISTGADSSIIDEIWTSSNDRKYFHASTMSSEMDSNLNIHENNRSFELRDKDSYLNDVENNKDPHKRSYYPSTPTTSGLGSSIEKTQSIETPRSHDPPSHLWYSRADDFSNYNTVKSSHAITRQPRPNPDWFKNDNKFISHRKFCGRPRNDDTEIWSSKIDNTNIMSGYMTQQNRQHRCYHQARKSFSTSMMTDLAAMLSDSQQSLGSTSILELEKSFAVSTPGDSSPVCYPPCSPPPAPAAYLSSVRASSRKLDGASGHPSPDRDSVGRLLRYLKSFYKEIATRDPHHLPSWTSFLPAGTFCPAHFQPHLQLIYNNDQEHRLERIKIDQIFSSVRLSDGILLEGPRRVAIEGGPGSGRTSLCLKLLHQWANQGDGPALAFMIPLRELRGNSIINYLTREFLPKSAALGDAIAQVWRTLHLLEDRVLFILDGYDECSGAKASLADAADLLEARLFPDARILVTCTPNNSSSLSTMVQRRILLTGLEWSHVEKLCVAYFIHNNLSEHACDFLENLNVQSQSAKEFIQYPLGWIMLCSLYRDAGKLPSECNTLIQEAIKGVVKKSLEDPLTPDEEIPIYYKKKLEDFGKLSLSSLRKGKCCYTETELRTRGGGIDITRLGFLTRGFTFGHRRKTEIYTPIHLAVIQYFAACYLASVSQFTNILRNELDGLPTEIISHLAALLGPRTHLILNQLCPLEIPPRMIFSLLKAAGTSDNNILSVCRLFGAASGFGPTPNEKPPVPLVQISPLELEGWTKILSSSACTLEALEVVFQVERGSDPTYLNNFFNALSNNESVKLVRITSLLGQEFSTDETQRLAEYLKSVLSKKKLNDFELVITCLEESSNDRLECVVCALCQGLRNASPHLSRVVLDMNLSSEQVSRVCKTLRDCAQVQALHLPHLSCGSDGLASVANLLKERPLFALNLAGSWGTKTEDPSSSGISMGSGSGSGSSGCASNTLGALSVNRCYSSLPRGTLAAYGSLTRPATLPRLPLGIGLNPSPATANGTLPQNDNDKDSSSGNSKRNSDSVLCHRLPVMHPLPTCDVACHQGTGFHEIFSTIREQNCKLRSLNVSKCLQGSLDASCLGETIRRARNLDAVRAAGASRPIDIMPLVLALTEAPCLQLLDLASPRLAIDDHPSRLLCHALARNETLRLLSLEGWTFRIEESDSLAVFAELLMCTSVRELNLCNARLHLAVHEGPLSRLGRRDDVGAELLRAAPPPTCPSIVFLRLAGFQVSVNDRLVLRGPLLLPFIAGFTALSDLDLSLDKSEIGNNNGSQLYIDDKILQQFFSCLAMNLKNLQTLRINYWQITLENSEKTMKHISKNLRLCNLNFLKANGLVVTDSVKRIQIEHVFIQTVLANLQALTWLCLDGIKLTENQCTTLGKWIKDKYPGNLLEISAKDINVKAVKAFVAAVEDGERIDINYTGGFICRLKISKLQKNSKNKSKFK